MSTEAMVESLRKQARACERLGSPLYAGLLERLADDAVAGGPASLVLAGHEDDPADAMLALRVAAAAHRLALSGQAPRLAAHYPSCGGDGDVEAAWLALRRLLADRVDDVRAGLGSAPQTNEVGRAAPLFGALLQLAGPAPPPVRLWEIGASGGLNLRSDRFRYQAADGAPWGPESSPVRLARAWDRLPTGAAAALDVVERVGGDLSPVDGTTDSGALHLASYVWPDQTERLERLRAAVTVARAHPATLRRCGAADLLSGLEPAPGTLTAVWHSVVWQYLDEAEQRAVAGRLEELGERAGDDSPLVHIAFEPPGDVLDGEPHFHVTARRWPGGQYRVLGTAPPHGLPVTWASPTSSGQGGSSPHSSRASRSSGTSAMPSRSASDAHRASLASSPADSAPPRTVQA